MERKPKKTPPTPRIAPLKPTTTSWGSVARWYDEHLEQGKDTYHEHVLRPNLLRVLALKQGERVLDVGCGQGYFTRMCADAGARADGADIAKELIAKARAHAPGVRFFVAPADKLTFAQANSYDTVTIVLAIQNIKHMSAVFAEAARVLTPGGRLVLVLNHPAFRIPKHSSWGWDEQARTQYRRVDKYLSQSSTAIVAHPGQVKSESTLSYHRSLQDFVKALSVSGFVIARLEEWISHKQSGKGPRQAAEDTARKEIPLFMIIEAKKSA